MTKQARNQEIFRAGKVFQELGQFDKNVKNTRKNA